MFKALSRIRMEYMALTCIGLFKKSPTGLCFPCATTLKNRFSKSYSQLINSCRRSLHLWIPSNFNFLSNNLMTTNLTHSSPNCGDAMEETLCSNCSVPIRNTMTSRKRNSSRSLQQLLQRETHLIVIYNQRATAYRGHQAI